MRQAMFLMLLSVTGIRAFAQVTLGASVESLYDDNVYNNSQSVASPATAFALQGGYVWDGESSSVALSYAGAVNYFSAVTEKTFSTHQTSLLYGAPLDADERTSFNAGAAYMVRVNREMFSIYDHGQLSLHATLEHRFSEECIGRAGYTFRSVRFAELPDFDYLEHYAFAQVTSLLPTNSTLILEADLGSKGYLTPDVSETGQSGHRGRGQSVVASDGPVVTQVIGMARIGHPIVEGTGLSLTFQYQGNIQKESRYVLSSGGVFSDDEFLDDHYGYEGPSGMLMLTQLIPGDARLRLSFSLQGRTYANRPAYDLSGFQIASSRLDTRKALSVLVSKSFEAWGCSLGLSYDYIINASNDSYYTFTNTALSLSVSVAY
jgi:hypothetical protein